MAIEGADLIKAAAFLGAGLSMGLGAIGPGVGEGMAAAKACEAIGRNPKEAGLLTRTMLVGQPFPSRPEFIRWWSHCSCFLWSSSKIFWIVAYWLNVHPYINPDGVMDHGDH